MRWTLLGLLMATGAWAPPAAAAALEVSPGQGLRIGFEFVVTPTVLGVVPDVLQVYAWDALPDLAITQPLAGIRADLYLGGAAGSSWVAPDNSPYPYFTWAAATADVDSFWAPARTDMSAMQLPVAGFVELSFTSGHISIPDTTYYGPLVIASLVEGARIWHGMSAEIREVSIVQRTELSLPATATMIALGALLVPAAHRRRGSL